MLNLPMLLLEAAGEAAPVAADAAAAGEEMAQPNMIASILQFSPMILIVVVFYFMLIRPQRKKDKAVKNMLAALKVGDRVCTIGGVYGTVIQIRDDIVTVAVGPEKVKMTFARWGIRSVEDVSIENEAEPEV